MTSMTSTELGFLNAPTVLIIDSEGTLQFKYMSQNTVDRPPLEYLVQVVDLINAAGG